MDPIRKRELKRQAFMRLAAQRRRAGLLRGRVVVLSLLCFVVLWGIVFAQMATGNDPVLSAKTKTVATRAAGASRREVETTDPRELEPVRKTDSAEASREEEAEAEPEVEVEPEAEEEAVEAEPEGGFVELEEAEALDEPLVTSQS